MKTRLPLYTPSLLAPETLEAIFVKREPLLQSLIEAHRESVTTDNKHFSLFVGPRGIGKTHLLSMFYHRIQSDKVLVDNTLTAWLREEEWGIAGYLDLLIHILTTLNVDGKAQEKIYELDVEDAEQYAEQYILELLGDRTLLLISENMDLIFDGLGKDGQHQLRAFIQNSAKITIVAAAQSLFTGVTLRKSPFFGFFDIQYLQPFSIDEAVELLVNIAEFDQKPDLVTMLKTSKGRVRVRALHHLANGNPRIYVTFSQLIHAEALDQFTDAVLQMLDELTPYYQAKMLQIPPQQRKIVQFLCRQYGTTVVSDIAKYTHLSHQAASSQLKKLRDAGYVSAISVGRASHYEIAEPLMRLVLEVKEARATPVKLLVNFIRHWFSIKELKEINRETECHIFGKPWIGREFIEDALAQNEAEHFYPQLQSCIDDYVQSLSSGDSQNLSLILEDLAELGESSETVEKAKPDELKEALTSGLTKIYSKVEKATDISEFEDCIEQVDLFVKHHAQPVSHFVLAISKLTFLVKCGSQLDFKYGKQLLKHAIKAYQSCRSIYQIEQFQDTLGKSIRMTIESLLKERLIDLAILTFEAFFELAEQVNTLPVWHATLEAQLLSLFYMAFKREDGTRIKVDLKRFTALESEFNDLAYARTLAKAALWKYNLSFHIGDQNHYPSDISLIIQLAEKYQDEEIWQLYKSNISMLIDMNYIENKSATILYNELQAVCQKHQLYDLLFRGTLSYWRRTEMDFGFYNSDEYSKAMNAPDDKERRKQLLDAFKLAGEKRAAEKLNTFDQLMKIVDNYDATETLVESAGQIINHIPHISVNQQKYCLEQLWQRLSQCENPEVFVGAVSKTCCEIARVNPHQYDKWYNSLLPLLESTTELNACLTILKTIHNYLENDKDESQLLVLPKEQRSLIRQALGIE